MAGKPEMRPFAARLETFQVPHQLSKRRASSQPSKKKGANTVEWPHKLPEARELARAGFYFEPAPGSPDNVQCFFCNVKLDGWEESDVPVKEHLAHSGQCQYALALDAALNATAKIEAQELDDLDQLNPMSDELVAARRATFELGATWPHESKKGWKCKVAKMVKAGWCFDPAASAVEDGEELDGVTCFYCSLSLDGWERQDDPIQEHKRRTPDCSFFFLVDRCGSGKPKKAGGRAGRASTTSKASRMSTQSTFSTFSEQPSLADTADLPAGLDDSIMTTGTTTSQATVTGKTGGKKKGKAKAPAKSGKGRKRAGTVDSQAEPESMYPDLSQSQGLSQSAGQQFEGTADTEAAAEFSVEEASQLKQTEDPDVKPSLPVEATSQKPARGRKLKAALQIMSEPEGNPVEQDPLDQSEVSAQLQEELDRSLSIDLEARFEREDRTPQPAAPATKPTRGTKRTSDGVQKSQQSSQADRDSSVMIVDFPAPPAAKAAPKGKKGRKASKQVQASAEGSLESQERTTSQPESIEQESQPTQPDVEPAEQSLKQTKSKSKGTKGRKASSTKSAKTPKSSASAAEPAPIFIQSEREEDLEQDERDIEAELARIAAEQSGALNDGEAITMETDKVDEFEPSPSSLLKKSDRSTDVEIHVDNIQHLERELQAEVDQIPQPGQNLATYVQAVARPSSGSKPPRNPDDATPSPSGSDKENAPSSVAVLDQTKPTAPIPSPSKTVRIPLAPGTPNRALLRSPAKHHLNKPTTTNPWEPMDLDTLLLASPTFANAVSQDPSTFTPGRTLAARLSGAAAAGTLSGEEREMTVEQWVRAQAAKGDAELRRRCEEMVARFEREGNRAMACLGGLVVEGQ